MEHQEVIDWLKYCDENNIKPWEWDFKNCYSDKLTSDSITNFLKYRNIEIMNLLILLFFEQQTGLVNLPTAIRKHSIYINFWDGKSHNIVSLEEKL